MVQQKFREQINSVIKENANTQGMLISAFSEFEFCSSSGEEIKKLSLDDNLKRSEYLELELIKDNFTSFELYYKINNNFFIDYIVFANNEIKTVGFVNKVLEYAFEMNQKSLIFLPKGTIFGWSGTEDVPKIVSISSCKGEKVKKVKDYESFKFKIFDIHELKKLLFINKTGKKCHDFEKENIEIVHIDFLELNRLSLNVENKFFDWREAEKKKIDCYMNNPLGSIQLSF